MKLLSKKQNQEEQTYDLDDHLNEEYLEEEVEEDDEDEEEEYEDGEEEGVLVDAPDGEEKESKSSTAIMVSIVVLLVLVFSVGILLLNKENSSEKEMKEWVANYIYEAVTEDGTSLLTDAEIQKISEDVSMEIMHTFGEGGTVSLETMDEAQLETFALQIREILMDNGYSLTPSDVTSISEGVLESYLVKQGVSQTDIAALGDLQNRLAELEAADEQLSESITNVASIKGQTGATGATGPKGDKGEKGDRGERGLTGATGATGRTGATGATGAKGDKGEKGDQGIQGIQGERGEQGEQGIQGIQGIQGERGEQGLQGAAGASSYMVFSEYPGGVDNQGDPSFTTSPTTTSKYMGVASSTEGAPTEAGAYTWTQYKESVIIFDDSQGKPTLVIH